MIEWLESGAEPPKQLSAQEILALFSVNCAGAETLEQLQKFFKIAYQALKPYQAEQEQAKALYDARKSTLTQGASE